MFCECMPTVFCGSRNSAFFDVSSGVTDMMDDDPFDGEAQPDAASDSPLVAISYFDSVDEMRGHAAEAWLDLQAACDDTESPLPMQQLSLEPAHFGLHIEIDAGLACSLNLYPVIAGEPHPEWGEGAAETLFQFSDDGFGGVDPQRVWSFFEFLLADILPFVGRDNRDELEERLAGGRRSFVFCDTGGCLLEMYSDDWRAN